MDIGYLCSPRLKCEGSGSRLKPQRDSLHDAQAYRCALTLVNSTTCLLCRQCPFRQKLGEDKVSKKNLSRVNDSTALGETSGEERIRSKQYRDQEWSPTDRMLMYSLSHQQSKRYALHPFLQQRPERESSCGAQVTHSYNPCAQNSVTLRC